MPWLTESEVQRKYGFSTHCSYCELPDSNNSSTPIHSPNLILTTCLLELRRARRSKGYTERPIRTNGRSNNFSREHDVLLQIRYRIPYASQFEVYFEDFVNVSHLNVQQSSETTLFWSGCRRFGVKKWSVKRTAVFLPIEKELFQEYFRFLNDSGERIHPEQTPADVSIVFHTRYSQGYISSLSNFMYTQQAMDLQTEDYEIGKRDYVTPISPVTHTVRPNVSACSWFLVILDVFIEVRHDKLKKTVIVTPLCFIAERREPLELFATYASHTVHLTWWRFYSWTFSCGDRPPPSPPLPHLKSKRLTVQLVLMRPPFI